MESETAALPDAPSISLPPEIATKQRQRLGFPRYSVVGGPAGRSQTKVMQERSFTAALSYVWVYF